MCKSFKAINDSGLICPVSVNDVASAVAVAQAVAQGNLTCLELAWNDQTLACIKAIKEAQPTLCVGIGQISHDVAIADLVTVADFISMPFFCADLIKKVRAVAPDFCLIPTVGTVSEIAHAHDLACSLVRLYPVCAQGKIEGVQAYARSCADMKFVISGLAQDEVFTSYLDLPCVAAVSEESFLPADLVQAQDVAALTACANMLFNQLMAFDVGHVGINAGTLENADKVTSRIMELFGTDKRETPLAFFSGDLVEVMKKPFVGQMGHICVDTRDLKRALAMLERKGVEFNPDLFMYNAQGKLMTAYLKEEIGGFAFHVRQRPASRW